MKNYKSCQMKKFQNKMIQKLRDNKNIEKANGKI